MSDWEKEIAELRTDVKHMLQSQETMQQEIKNLQKFSAMGAGGLKALVIIGIVLGIIAKWMGFFD
jgi:prefoldin subunit 5|tara:strand:- start:1043 stop:1237 length:195 start_codon:yes stop_codon:yes gene_type:complete